MTKRIGLSLFLAFLCLGTFTKCSTGASNTSSNTPASIAGIQDGQDDVSASELFTVMFVAPVDLSTVTSSSFFLVSADSDDALPSLDSAPASSDCNLANAIAASVSCASPISCVLTPLSALEFNTTYSLCLTSDIRFVDPQTYGVFVGTQTTFTTETQNDRAIGGSITGLVGTVVLQNNDDDFLEITEDGAFEFDELYPSGTAYQVSVAEQPDTQTCSIANASGTVSGSDVTDVTVVCSVDTYSVGGEVFGLNGTLVLQNNAADDLSLNVDGVFEFATVLADTSEYEITVLAQPIGQTCVISQGDGTLAGAEISDVEVNCTVNSYAVGGSVSGLTGTLVLQNNGSDNKTIISDGAYSFSSPIAYNVGYTVTIFSQPAGQVCYLSNPSGTMGTTAIANVNVNCVSEPTVTSVSPNAGF